MRMLKGGPLGAVGTARSFMNVVKDIDFEETRNRAETAPSILVLASSEDLVQTAANLLFGEDDRNGIVARTWADAESTFDPVRHDVVIVYDPEGSGLFDKVRARVGKRSDNANIFFLSANLSEGSDPVREVRTEILEMLPDMAPAFGRFHPLWRKSAVKAIVDQTSKANAQFALVSNVPAVVPILGGLISASADLLVLTKNQVMMCYKIAAAHGENLDNHLAIVRELAPVVGAGFVWRTAAREAASFIPFAAGTIPKVGIAFAGTMAMGRAADFYYEHGSKPSRSQMDRIRAQAVELAERVPVLKQFVGDDEDITAAIASISNGADETTVIDVEPKDR